MFAFRKALILRGLLEKNLIQFSTQRKSLRQSATQIYQFYDFVNREGKIASTCNLYVTRSDSLVVYQTYLVFSDDKHAI